MKKMRFKSLTMTIWTYFTLMIIFIVAVFFVINMFMIKEQEEDKTFKNLQIFQERVLNGDIQGAVHGPGIAKGKIKNNNNDKKGELADIDYFFIGENNKIFLSDKDKFIVMQTKKALEDKKWMASYISKVKNSSKNFLEKYKDGRNIMFLIKKVNISKDKKYIVTYSYRVYKGQDFTQLIYISIGIIFFGLIISKLISSNISKPLKTLELYTEKIAKKEWAEPIIIDREDEIGRLALSMNKMQNSLKSADEEEQAFLQSISHDLKTPVMVIKSYAEAILDGIYIDNLEETAKIISGESSKLEHKIKQLLYFNSLNYIMENDKVSNDVKMDLVFKDLYERLKLIRSDIEWELKLEEVVIKCNNEKIVVSLENIIENQLRYAESKISIKLNKIQNNIMIEIYNDGPNIKEENIDKIFEKFYKEKKGNFGLGLAISQKIIEHYNGNIHAENLPVGVRFIINIPRT
jgi:two-component system sensor histidine kinase CssS